MGGRFLFRNTNMSTLSGLTLALFYVTIFPEVEFILSEGTGVPGMHNSCLATLDRVGSLSAFVFFTIPGHWSQDQEKAFSGSDPAHHCLY